VTLYEKNRIVTACRTLRRGLALRLGYLWRLGKIFQAVRVFVLWLCAHRFAPRLAALADYRLRSMADQSGSTSRPKFYGSLQGFG